MILKSCDIDSIIIEHILAHPKDWHKDPLVTFHA